MRDIVVITTMTVIVTGIGRKITRNIRVIRKTRKIRKIKRRRKTASIVGSVVDLPIGGPQTGKPLQAVDGAMIAVSKMPSRRTAGLVATDLKGVLTTETMMMIERDRHTNRKSRKGEP